MRRPTGVRRKLSGVFLNYSFESGQCKDFTLSVMHHPVAICTENINITELVQQSCFAMEHWLLVVNLGEPRPSGPYVSPKSNPHARQAVP